MRTFAVVRFALLCALPGFAPVARAAVVETTPQGFEVRKVVAIAAPPEAVYEAFVKVGSWWSSDHTFSGDAGNLSLDPRPGGCFCEKLPDGGGVVHLMVVNLAPGKMIRLRGALGPLQSGGLAGAMTVTFAANGSGTELTMTYDAGGYFPGGLESIASAVDFVLSQQFDRLARFVETGSPESGPAERK